MTAESPRHAIYYAPDSRSARWRFGSSVIGYDAVSGTDVPFLTTAGMSTAEWSGLTAEPRQYGFHATLKAPFYLADGCDDAHLLDRAAAFAATHAAIELEGLQVSALSRFIALTPIGDVDKLMTLASAVVEAFDDLRAPLTDRERVRRLSSPLKASQVAHLDRYGYPYVHEEFRFHMTLTGPVSRDKVEALRAHLADIYAVSAVPATVQIDALTLFRQDNRASRFRIIGRLPLAAIVPPSAANT